ncbi:MAG: hypothetical protein JRK53_09205, partial [Deltaproteobacteria bacterium]|nr:hypothetical protein [Deltaproteobacteria bacterium]
MANRTAKHFLDARTRPIWALLFLLIPSLLLAWPATSLPAEGGRVAVLPFRVHAPVALDYLKFGLQEMLTLRLGTRGMDTLPPEIVNRHAEKAGPATDVSDMAALGKAMGAR